MLVRRAQNLMRIVGKVWDVGELLGPFWLSWLLSQEEFLSYLEMFPMPILKIGKDISI